MSTGKGHETEQSRRPAVQPVGSRAGVLDQVIRPFARLSTSRSNLRAGLTSDWLIGAVLCAAAFHRGPPHALAGALAVSGGLFAFSFIEYAVHRWLFHGNTGPLRAGHTRHHVDPHGHDALPFFIPPLFMCALAWLFSLVLPVAPALLLAGSIAVGYALYGSSHAILHVHRFHNPLLRRWASFHNIHHFHPETNFGVTTGLWDLLLGTRYRHRAHHGAVHA